MLDIEELSPSAHRVTVMGAFHYDDAEKFIAFAKDHNADGKGEGDRKSTRLNSSHPSRSRMPSSA